MANAWGQDMRLLPLLLTACATTALPPPSQPAGGPRGLRASEHREVAHDQDELAREQRSFPVRSQLVPGDPTTGPRPMPWFRSWDPAADHERRARVHRSEAAALEADHADACGARELSQVVTSPLTRHRMGGWNTSAGVVVYLRPQAGTADTLLADLRCHRAWMMLAPTGTMDDCPLDLPGVRVDARGDEGSITLVISVADPKLVPELQRRVAKQAEQPREAQHEH